MESASNGARSGWLVLYPLWIWLGYFPLVSLATLVGALIAVPLALLISPRLANLYVAVTWSRILAGLVPVRVSLEGAEHIEPGRSYVVVANHQSQFDIPVVYGWLGLDLRWVAKSEVGRIPFVAAGCRAIGHIFIDRSDPDQARNAINRAVARLKPGTGLMFFPEGTRSRSGRLLPFKKGAFRVAVDRQLPLLPVTVTGTRDILPPGGLALRPGRARLVVHEPVETDGLDASDLSDVQRECKRRIASALPPESAC
jgi:1-acyl-sn-glycerol-3-phosphate acyltransferase